MEAAGVKAAVGCIDAEVGAACVVMVIMEDGPVVKASVVGFGAGVLE